MLCHNEVAFTRLCLESVFRHSRPPYELVVGNNGRSERQVAGVPPDALLFLSFGFPEGCPLPPAEAMACGCVVIGYHGWGGREFFRPEFSYPIAVGDVLTFARKVEGILRWHAIAPTALAPKAQAAADFIRRHYSIEQEERDIVGSWQAILRMP